MEGIWVSTPLLPYTLEGTVWLRLKASELHRTWGSEASHVLDQSHAFGDSVRPVDVVRVVSAENAM